MREEVFSFDYHEIVRDADDLMIETDPSSILPLWIDSPRSDKNERKDSCDYCNYESEDDSNFNDDEDKEEEESHSRNCGRTSP